MSIHTHVSQIHKVDIYNIDPPHAFIEMILSSLFTDEYTTKEQTLIATNNTIEYTYTKGPSGNMMTVRVVSLNAMHLPFEVRFAGESFPLRKLTLTNNLYESCEDKYKNLISLNQL